MPVNILKEYLDINNVKYISITHSTAYTSQEIAALTHTKGRELAKTVVIKLDGDLALAVLPASHQVALPLLKAITGATEIGLATELEFRTRFPGCETGAMPPFGNLYELPVFVDETLTVDKEIVFNAGTHNELIRLAFADFERLVQPRIVRFVSGKAKPHAA